MNLSKSIKTILIIFVLITTIGLFSNLVEKIYLLKINEEDILEDSVPGDDNNTKPPVDNEGENPGDNVEDSPTEDTEHVYNEYDVCRLCGIHRAGQLYIDKQPVYDDESYIHLGTFGGMGNEAYFLVLFDLGQDDEVGFYVYYNGSENCDTHYFNNDLMNLTFGSYVDEVFLLSARQSSDFSKYDTVSIYLLNESFEHECYDSDVNCACDICGFEKHSYAGVMCENCGSSIEHECYDSDVDCICDFCGSEKHSYVGNICENCYSTDHECYDSDGEFLCDICGSCCHVFNEGGSCYYCDLTIDHTTDLDSDTVCDLCGGDLTDYLLGTETDHRDSDDDGKCDGCLGSFCDGND